MAENRIFRRFANGLLFVGWMLALMGCAPEGSQTEASPVMDTMAVETTETEAAPNTFTNPVLDQDFPDPDLLLVDGVYYAYATNTGETNIQVSRSTDLVHWTILPDALPQLPGWASQEFGYAWAPRSFQACRRSTVRDVFRRPFCNSWIH